MEDGHRIARILAKRLDRSGVTALSVAAAAPPEGPAAITQGPRLVVACRGTHRMAVSGHDKELALRPGEALLMPPGTWNRALPGEPRRYCSLTLQADGLRAFLRRHDGRGLASSPCWAQMLPRPEGDEQALWRLLLARCGDPPQAHALAAVLCWSAVRALADPTVGNQGGGGRWSRMVAWLAEQVPLLPDRDSVARHVGVHPGWVSQLFRDHAGCSFQDWCAARRLEYARDLLLAYPQLPVAAVAERCGYGDPRYFRRQFKRRFGQPPALCRDGGRRWAGNR